MGVRFAPSPTGRFHVGNLRTAWISRWWATALRLPWVVRFEDIDVPRLVPGARETQLSDLARLGLVPDEIVLQSERRARHRTLFERAVAAGVLYRCVCSRKEVLTALAGVASAPHGAPPLYNGRCRPGAAGAVPAAVEPAHPTVAWRFRAADESGREDFIAARTDAARSEGSFVPGYHWACAIDDADGGYALLVRAADLDIAVAPQRAVQTWLAGRDGGHPAIFHCALVTRPDGGRLEKRTRGVTLPELEAAGTTADTLAARFAASFSEPSSGYAPGRIWTEKPPLRTLEDLGLGSA